MQRTTETLYHAWVEGGTPLPALHEAAAALLRADREEAVFAALTSALAAIPRVRRCFLWVKDAQGPDAFYGAAVRPAGEPGAPSEPWRPQAGDRTCWDACRKAMLRGRPIEAVGTDGVRRSLLAVPLATSQAATGVLYLEGDMPEGRFTAGDLAWCQAIAPTVAAAIELVRLRAAWERQGRELAEALAKYQTAEREASTDALTTLANRRSFLDHADRQTAIARRYGAPYAVLLIDVDHFKACNDIYGHAAGDLVLKMVGQVLLRSIRQPDLAARYGGEEFVILCPNTDARKAALLAERVRKAIAAARPEGEGLELPPGITASVGVATFLPTDDHVAGVLERADRALYRAKRDGRNRVVLAETP